MATIKGTNPGIVSTIALAILFVSVRDNAFEVYCEQSNVEQISRNPRNVSGLIFIEENRINIYHPNEEKLFQLVTSTAPKNPVFSCERETLYWIDEYSKIKARKFFSESQSIDLVHEDTAAKLTGLALDFITDKLYMSNMEIHTIEVVDLKTGNRGIVRSEKLWSIESIAIDPNEGYLFIIGAEQFVRMDLDGMNLHYIVPKEPKFKDGIILTDLIHINIYTIALDLEEKRVYGYWEKIGDAFFSSMAYDGTDQKLHLKLEPFQYSKILEVPIVFYSKSLYWIDNNRGEIRGMNLSDAKDNKMIYKGIPKKMFSMNSVSCISTGHKQVVNPCKEHNGGCQHLCVLSRSSKDNYRCFCNVGYELANDGTSCILPTTFIALSQIRLLRGVHWREDIKQYIDVLNPSKHRDVWNPPKHTVVGGYTFDVDDETIGGYSFDVDAEESVFYQSNRRNLSLYSMDLENRAKVFLQQDLDATTARNLAFDWASKNLYYLNDYYMIGNVLRVLNTKNPTYNKIIANVSSICTGLVVHPNRGYVYFFNLTAIMRIHTDGSNFTTLDNNKKYVSCITIDYAEDKLYWSENEGYSPGVMIYHSNLDGKNITKVGVNFSSKYFKMAIQRDWIFIAAHGLLRVPKKGGELEQVIASKYVRSMRIFDRSIQTTRSDHPCASKENTCDKFCFAVPGTKKVDSLERVCGCPYGEKLADDGRSCVDNSKEEPPEFKCSSIACLELVTMPHPLELELLDF